ncbi:hypothetical protein D3C77_464760 [compost metagenome]
MMCERHVVISIFVYNARIGGIHIDQRIFECTPMAVVWTVSSAAVRLFHPNHSYYNDDGDAKKQGCRIHQPAFPQYSPVSHKPHLMTSYEHAIDLLIYLIIG